MLIILLEYTCNMVLHIHSKYTFIDLNTPNYILYINSLRPSVRPSVCDERFGGWGKGGAG